MRAIVVGGRTEGELGDDDSVSTPVDADAIRGDSRLGGLEGTNRGVVWMAYVLGEAYGTSSGAV